MKVKIDETAQILAGNEYDFSSNITILIGSNGIGKSTLLKAIILNHVDKWELNTDYKLPKDKLTIEDKIDDLGYYVAEANLKGQMSHMDDDIGFHLQNMRSSSGESTLGQVMRTFSHKLIILDEPDQSLDICNSILLSEMLPRVVAKHGCKIILTIHSVYLLQKLSDLENVKIIDVKTGNETTAEEYLTDQYRLAMKKMGKSEE